MLIQLKRLRDSARMPTYGSIGAACFDLYAAETVKLMPGQTRLIKLGFAMGIPDDHEVTIRPRSGMSLKTKLRMPNAPGTIDSDYKGEVSVILENSGDELYTVESGDRIAQAKLQRVERTTFSFVHHLSPTSRGDGGFGSTGK